MAEVKLYLHYLYRSTLDSLYHSRCEGGLRQANIFYYTTMKIILLLSCLVAGLASTSAQCYACLDGNCYSRVTVFEGQQSLGQIAIDRTGNILYFHFENSNKTKDYTGPYYLNDIRFDLISDIDFTFARAVDQKTREVYISGAQGLYKYNPITNITTQVLLSDDMIWHLQYEQKLYYTNILTKGIYTFENGKSNSISALSNYQIEDFIVDKRGDIYFMSDEFTVYKLRSGSKTPIIFADDDIYALATDKNGNAFFNQPVTRGLYKLNYETNAMEEVGAFNEGRVYNIIFDSDNNVIYQVDKKIYYLTPNYGRCRVTTKGSGRLSMKVVTTIVKAA